MSDYAAMRVAVAQQVPTARTSIVSIMGGDAVVTNKI
jgi:hypothetical protein